MSRKEVLRLCHPFENPIVENTRISGSTGWIGHDEISHEQFRFLHWAAPAEFQARRNKGLDGDSCRGRPWASLYENCCAPPARVGRCLYSSRLLMGDENR